MKIEKELKEMLRFVDRRTAQYSPLDQIKFKSKTNTLIYINYTQPEFMIEYKLENKLFDDDCLIDVDSLRYYIKNHKFLDIESIKSNEERNYPTLDYKETEFYQIRNLSSIIKSMVPFVSKDEMRKYLNGIYFDKNSLVATNGHISFEHRLTNIELKDNFILPHKICLLLTKIDDLKFCYYQNEEGEELVIFKNDKIKIIAEPITGSYKVSIPVEKYSIFNKESIINFDENLLRNENQSRGCAMKLDFDHDMKGSFKASCLQAVIDVARNYNYKDLSFDFRDEDTPVRTEIEDNFIILSTARWRR